MPDELSLERLGAAMARRYRRLRLTPSNSELRIEAFRDSVRGHSGAADSTLPGQTRCAACFFAGLGAAATGTCCPPDGGSPRSADANVLYQLVQQRELEKLLVGGDERKLSERVPPIKRELKKRGLDLHIRFGPSEDTLISVLVHLLYGVPWEDAWHHSGRDNVRRLLAMHAAPRVRAPQR